MTGEQSIKLVAAMATAWDQRAWSEEKIDLYSRMLVDLEYRTTSQAVRWLIQHAKWPPTVAEVRERVLVIEKARHARKEIAENRRLMRSIEDKRAEGLPALPEYVREAMARVKSIPGVKVLAETNGHTPQTLEQIEERKRVLRQQAEFLKGQEEQQR
jgi:hypothetical protein